MVSKMVLRSTQSKGDKNKRTNFPNMIICNNSEYICSHFFLTLLLSETQRDFKRKHVLKTQSILLVYFLKLKASYFKLRDFERIETRRCTRVDTAKCLSTLWAIRAEYKRGN